MAAAECGRSLVYYSFNKSDLTEELTSILQKIRSHNPTVGKKYLNGTTRYSLAQVIYGTCCVSTLQSYNLETTCNFITF